MPTTMQWTVRLLSQIDVQKRYASPFEQRYANKHVLPFVLKEYRDVYGDQVDALWRPALDPPRAGTAAVIVDALAERLGVLGGTSEDEAAARLVQRAWEDNDLDVMHREAHREALIKSRAFGSVHRDASGSQAIVGIESPDQMAVHRMSSPPYDVDAALKVSVDEWTGKGVGQLRLPGLDIPLVEQDTAVSDPDGDTGVSSRWVASGPGVPTGVPWVTVVEFAHQPRLLTAPISAIDPITTLVDLSDLIEALLVFAGHFGAVPIRWGTGLTALADPKNPASPLLGPDGKPRIGFKPRADHFWGDSNSEAKFGQMVPADLTSFVVWAEHVAARLRAATSVASTYFSLDLKSHMSAELLKTDEAPMVRRINAIGPRGAFNQGHRQLLRTILAIEAPGSAARVLPRWEDPQTRVEAQAVDSFGKAVAGGLGVQIAAEQYLGWAPDVARRAVEQGREDRRKAAEAAADASSDLGRESRGLLDLAGAE